MKVVVDFKFFGVLTCLFFLQATVCAWQDCTLPPPIMLENDLAMQQIANYEAGTYTMKFTYTGGRAWIGIGINSEGNNKMTPANAVIGRAYSDGTTSVLKYSMTTDAQDGSGVTPLAASSQTLTDVSFVQTDSTTELTFTQPLNEPEQVVGDDSTWIYGVGLDDNQWVGKHKIHGSFLLPLTSCVNVPDTPNPTKAPSPSPTVATPSPTRAPVILEPTGSPKPSVSHEPTSAPTASAPPTSTPTADPTSTPSIVSQPTPTENNIFNANAGSQGAGLVVLDTTHPYRALWAAHGIILVIAWGCCAPLGIGVSILRNGLIKAGLDKGFWYRMHFYLNLSTVVLTVVGFIIAFVATHRESTKNHLYDTHHKAGLAILILVLVQAFFGYYRPGLPKPPQDKKNDTDGKDSSEKEDVDLTTTDDRQSGSAVITTDKSSDDDKPLESKKSALRLGWEYFHRLLGMLLLGLAWYNCHSGIEWQLANWEDQRDWTGVFWGITAGISGMIFLLAYVIRV